MPAALGLGPWGRQSDLVLALPIVVHCVCSLAKTRLSSRSHAHIQPWQGGLPPTDQVEQCRDGPRKVRLPLPGDGSGARGALGADHEPCLQCGAPSCRSSYETVPAVDVRAHMASLVAASSTMLVKHGSCTGPGLLHSLLQTLRGTPQHTSHRWRDPLHLPLSCLSAQDIACTCPVTPQHSLFGRSEAAEFIGALLSIAASSQRCVVH